MHSLSQAMRRLILPLVAAVSMPAVHAQYAGQPVAPAPAAEPGSDLARYLSMLADNPDSVPALTGAGKAALDLGDGEAALNFFGRADVLSPQDGTIKAGLASGLVLMEQAQAAMPLFDEALRLGIPVGEIAGYRGLAYDLLGDPARAQLDYRAALRRREDPEVRRRFALSLAISGQRDAALSAIDEQLRRQDRAAWRVRAFILALTGDAQGAYRLVQAAMPSQAAAMEPFLARLPSLSLADRALAVHFGHFPGAPGQTQMQATTVAQTAPSAPARMDSVTAAGRPDVSQQPLGQLAGVRAAQSTPAATVAPPPPPIAVTTSPPRPSVIPAPSALAPQPVSTPAPALQAPAAKPAPSLAPPPSIGPPDKAAAILKPSAVAPSRLADLGSLLARMSDVPPAKVVPGKTSATAAKKIEHAPPKEPSREWVQIAHMRNKTGLASEYRRIKAKAPKLFAGKFAWTAEQGGTNRLLVGPFKSDKEAQAFVNQLADKNVDAFSWTSAEGQEIEKLPAR